MVHDLFDGTLDQLLSIAAIVKSPIGLADALTKAVFRTKTPLSLDELNTRYKESLKKIKSTAELSQVQG